jgi:hypothetical protein
MNVLLGELMNGDLPSDRFPGLGAEIEQLLVVDWRQAIVLTKQKDSERQFCEASLGMILRLVDRPNEAGIRLTVRRRFAFPFSNGRRQSPALTVSQSNPLSWSKRGTAT